MRTRPRYPGWVHSNSNLRVRASRCLRPHEAASATFPVSVPPTVHNGGMNLECLADHDGLEPDTRSGFTFSSLRAAVCPECDSVVWWNGDDRLPAWDGVSMGIGQAAIIDRMPAISAPSEEVAVCRTP